MAQSEVAQLPLSGTGSSFGYLRRDPERSFLYQTVRENWQTFLAHAENTGKGLPFYVVREFEGYLKCGILAYGFARMKCEQCRHEKLVAFSCKKRGFCPSCCGRRMAETGVFLSERMFPKVPVRQWVMSFPVPLRYWMAANPKLMSTVLGIVTRAVAGFYRKRGIARGIGSGETGAVTLVQRFGNSVNVNVHFHQLWVEGVFAKSSSGVPGHRWVPKPADQDISQVLETIQKRVLRLLIKRGYLEAADKVAEDTSERLETDEPLFASLMSASTQNRIATGDRSGQRVRKVGSFGVAGERAIKEGSLCAYLGGFSLHANVFIEAGKPKKLERLCRYVSRPPVAEDRLYRLENGDIGYFLKSEWKDGTFAVRFSPHEFIEKIVALIPQPRIHMTRYHGVLAPNHSWRDQIVPGLPPETKSDDKKPGLTAKQRMTWAELLKRVFQIDLTTCPDCGGAVKFISAIMKRDVVVKILEHLNLPSEQPKWVPARAPPAMAFDL